MTIGARIKSAVSGSRLDSIKGVLMHRALSQDDIEQLLALSDDSPVVTPDHQYVASQVFSSLSAGAHPSLRTS
jgi:hypothetical protein